jgi:hypothetical protein
VLNEQRDGANTKGDEMIDQRCTCGLWLVEIRSWQTEYEKGVILQCPKCKFSVVEIDGWAQRVIHPSDYPKDK